MWETIQFLWDINWNTSLLSADKFMIGISLLDYKIYEERKQNMYLRRILMAFQRTLNLTSKQHGEGNKQLTSLTFCCCFDTIVINTAPLTDKCLLCSLCTDWSGFQRETETDFYLKTAAPRQCKPSTVDWYLINYVRRTGKAPESWDKKLIIVIEIYYCNYFETQVLAVRKLVMDTFKGSLFSGLTKFYDFSSFFWQISLFFFSILKDCQI